MVSVFTGFVQIQQRRDTFKYVYLTTLGILKKENWVFLDNSKSLAPPPHYAGYSRAPCQCPAHIPKHGGRCSLSTHPQHLHFKPWFKEVPGNTESVPKAWKSSLRK